MSVRAIVAAQYIQNLPLRTNLLVSASQLNIGMLRDDATNVTRRNASATTASVFIDKKFCLLAVASVLDFSARAMFSLRPVIPISRRRIILISLNKSWSIPF